MVNVTSLIERQIEIRITIIIIIIFFKREGYDLAKTLFSDHPEAIQPPIRHLPFLARGKHLTRSSTWSATLPTRNVRIHLVLATELVALDGGSFTLVFSQFLMYKKALYKTLPSFTLQVNHVCLSYSIWSLCRFWPWLTGRKATWIIKSCKNMFFCILDIAIANSMAVHRLQNEPGRVEAGTCQGVPAAKRKTRKDEEPSGPQPTPSIPCFAADDAPWVPWVSRSPVSVQWNVDPLFPKQHLFPTTKVGKSKLSYSAFLSSRETKTVLA